MPPYFDSKGLVCPTELKCWLVTGGNRFVRNFARACEDRQTGERAPTVSKYRNAAFPYLEQAFLYMEHRFQI